MTYAPAQQIKSARNIARSAQRQIKTRTGMHVSLMLCPVENTFESPTEMLGVIATTLGKSPDCFQMKARLRDIVEMRFIAAILLRMHFPKFTLTQIASLFGGQDHSSIVSGIARAHNLIYTGDPRFIEKYNHVLKSVNAWLRREESGYASALSA